jgi:hypothetical protein
MWLAPVESGDGVFDRSPDPAAPPRPAKRRFVVLYIGVVARVLIALIACLGVLVGCGQSTAPAAPAPSPESSTEATGGASGQRFPNIVAAQATKDGSGTYTFVVTVSSPYDTPQRYADGWRVLGPDQRVYGEHTLTHDHASEQPFTRTQSGVTIPDDVSTVTIQGRDKVDGYGGGTVEVELPAR